MDFSSHVSGARDGKLYENLYVSLISTCEQIIINKLERKRERETDGNNLPIMLSCYVLHAPAYTMVYPKVPALALFCN